MEDSGPSVAELQRALTDLGLYSGKIDGVFGSKTGAALKAFQKSRGLAVDGIVSLKTAAKINAAVEAQ